MNRTDENGYMAVAAAIAVTNCWNPIGWIAAGVAAVGLIVLVAIAVDNIEYHGIDTFTEPATQEHKNIAEASNSDSSTDSSSRKRQGPVGKAGRKKQGRETNEKKKIGKGKKWINKGNKDPNRPMKKHTPGRNHRRVLIPEINVNDEKNQCQIRWSE